MYRTVMAVFSGTDVDHSLFERGVRLASEHGARLVLLSARHLHQADDLGELLSSGAFMGRGTIETLKRSVKEQRDHVILRALAAMEEEARQEGLEVEVRAVKGPYAESVTAAAHDTSCDAVVVEDRPESAHLKGSFEVIRV